MKARWVVGVVVGALVVSLAGPAAAGQGDKIVRTKSLLGLPVITNACAVLGCTVLGSLDVLPGDTTSPSSLFLVRGLVQNTVTWLMSLLGIAAVEPDLPVGVALDDSWGSSQASVAVLDSLWHRTPMTYYGSTAWQAYFEQPASAIVRLPQTHCSLRATGGAIVAVIDTGVDPNHATLAAVLTDGYDFTRDVAGGDEVADAGQAPASLDGAYCVNQASVAVLDQASVAVLDGTQYAAFGHGTMVAGVVHLVAPTARIMPLKAFTADGQGYTSSILRAVYYASLKGAKVLNMSFSRPTSSPELKRAIDNATGNGLVAVAAAGNDGQATLVYPAAYSNVMGVASTTNADTRSSFSNYGSNLVWVAAPGEGVITTYPFGSFAAAWGTSFSTPFVSGGAALLAGLQGGASYSQVSSAIARAKTLTSDLGYGRLDLYRAVQYGRSLWPSAPLSAVPASCASDGVDWSAAP
ncbi:MAG: hypothetical protein DMF78_09530 [Acidobacteria bacterium]|nr:MAG: hypothetical protein DMF78_09530 [Acidobacteriota bacterium]